MSIAIDVSHLAYTYPGADGADGGAADTVLLGDHRQNVHGTGQTGDLYAEPEKPPAMVFVGKLGKTLQLAPQDHGIFSLFHKSTL